MTPKSDFDRNIELFIKLAFLCEEIFIAVVGAVKRKKALFWIAAPIVVLITLNLTEGMVWFWLILIGLGLIAFVIWKLLKTQQKQLPTSKPVEPKESPKTPATPPKN